MFLVLLFLAVIAGLAYYVSQVAFVDIVIEMQFTAFQGSVLIESSNAIWRQVAYSVIYSLINLVIVGLLWYRHLFANVVRIVSTYWILGMNILTLTGVVYYIMLVIQNNS
jgi:hypothetical protein